MVQWVNAEERLPKNQEHDPCNNYHFVLYDWGTGVRLGKGVAMYMDGEWRVNYTAKLVKPVKYWLEYDDNMD